MAKNIKAALYELVQSMTKSEKRYFKLLASLHTIGEKNNYVVLFDYLDNQPIYDEEQLFKDFKGEAFLNKFSITKRRLYDHLIDALNQFHSAKHAEDEIFRLLSGARVLFDKALYDQSDRMLVSAEKLARKLELTHLILAVDVAKKKRFEQTQYFNHTAQELTEYQLQEEEDNMKHRYQQQLFWIKSRLFRLLNQTGISRNEEQKNLYNQIFQELQELHQPNNPSIESQYLYNHILSAYYFAIRENETSFQYLKKNRDLLQNHSLYLGNNPEKYLSVLSNLIHAADQNQLQQEATAFLAELKTFQRDLQSTAAPDLQAKIFATTVSVELNYHFNRGQFDTLKERCHQVKAEMATMSDALSHIRRAFLHYRIAVVELMTSQPQQALKTVRKVLNESELDHKEDIVSQAHFLEILIHLELGNDRIIPHLVQVTQRFLKQRNRLDAFERMLLNCLLRISQRSHHLEKLEQWEALYRKLMDWPKQQWASGSLNWIAWVASRCQQVNYIDFIQNQTRGRGPFAA